MGLWDKIKSVKNMVTGGAADVFVEITNANFEEGITVNTRVVVKDADLKMEKIYLRLRSVEHVKAPDIDIAQDRNGVIHHIREDVHHQEVIHNEEFIVTGAETLQSGREYSWTTEINLGEDANASYYGNNAKHVWQVYAGVDCYGNDPDSGWVEFDLY